jgi:hypothetical protein
MLFIVLEAIIKKIKVLNPSENYAGEIYLTSS